METSSWIVVLGFISVTFGVGLYFARRANSNTTEYFLSGRTLPWWILGTSMVITTFAPDTPIGVSSYVREGTFNGWFGWNLVMGQVLAVFLFARLWRRSGVTTDNQLLEMRYSGRGAPALRLFKALHFSLLYNLVTLATVMTAVVSVFHTVVDFDRMPAFLGEHLRWILAGMALLYAVLAGFWGVVATDFIQFWVAIIGTSVFAWLCYDHVGGMEPLNRVASENTLAFFPTDGGDQLHVLAFMFIMWWGTYNADGSGYLAQRMLAAKNERHASLGALWFSVAYAAIRMWPWVLVGSMSLVLFPTLQATNDGVLVNGIPSTSVTGSVLLEPESPDQDNQPSLTRVEELEVRAVGSGTEARVVTATGQTVQALPGKLAYGEMMRRVLGGRPILLGVLIAAFLAAFLSTVDTLLNWGSSYLVYDVFKRFVDPEASEKKLLLLAKIAVTVVMAGAVLLSTTFTSITGAWIFTWSISAGLGPVIILRWFWWRVNAWSEIAALSTSLVVALGFKVCNMLHFGDSYVFAKHFSQKVAWVGDMRLEVWHQAIILVGASTLMVFLTAWKAPQTKPEILDAFVKKVRPPGFWNEVRLRVGRESAPDHSLKTIAWNWCMGVSFIYGVTFLIGGWIYGKTTVTLMAIAALVIGAAGIWRSFSRSGQGR